MWLLNTARAELKFFHTPESVPRGYAILSHVWDEQEESFQDIQTIQARCAADGTNPRDFVSAKIRNFCILAERDGYEWGWDDTCCIDKTSSADLSEAINSMYRYYSLADVCYAYLRDVPTDCELHAPNSAFRRSRWHQRGWTLQELIAPPLVVLVSKTWDSLGSKADLAGLLEEITRIPAGVLNLEETPSSYCVAARMAWAAKRETTRPEDEAYCLMGIFGISMPPLYGEGKKAFLRLQEEIIGRVDDPSIFIWGEILDPNDFNVLFSDPWRDRSLLSDVPPSLLARSPADFGCIGHFAKRPEVRRPKGVWKAIKSTVEQFAGVEPTDLPTFSVTPYGIKARVQVCTPFPIIQPNLVVAVLSGTELCFDSESSPENPGLVLARRTDTRRQQYDLIQCSASKRILRGLPLSGTVSREKLEWRTIYIIPAPPAAEPPGLHLLTRSMHIPFHIPRWHVAELLQFPGVTSSVLDDANVRHGEQDGTMTLTFTIEPPGSSAQFVVVISLGLCRASGGNPKHWARVERRQPDSGWKYKTIPKGDKHKHVCATHHVDAWPEQTCSFTIGPGPNDAFLQLQVKLSFQPYTLNPTRVRKVHITFDIGRAFAGLGSEGRGHRGV